MLLLLIIIIAIIKHHSWAAVEVLALYLVSFDTTMGMALLLLGRGRSPDSPWGILWHYPTGVLGHLITASKGLLSRFSIWALLAWVKVGAQIFLCGVWLEHSIYYFKFYYFAWEIMHAFLGRFSPVLFCLYPGCWLLQLLNLEYMRQKRNKNNSSLYCSMGPEISS